MGVPGQSVARSLTWPLTPALLVATVVILLDRPGDAAPVTAADLPFVAAMLTCWLVGVVLTGQAFRQPAGWAFLGLGTALAWSAFLEAYTDLALRSDANSWLTRLAATLGDTSFVWWFVFLALVLQFTPQDETSRRSRLPVWTVSSGLVFQVTALLRPGRLDAPYERISSPWGVQPLAEVMSVLSSSLVVGIGVCLVASGVGLIRAWRRAVGEARRQLLWLVAGTLPLPPCVAVSFAASYADRSDVAGYVMSVATVAVAVGAALSVLRFRLYDVERVVTESAAYAIASVTVILTFVTVVVTIARTTPIDPASQVPVILATLAGAAAARVSYAWGKRAVDRRMDRARFDAVRAVRTGLDDVAPDLDLLLASSLDDARARVVYPTSDGGWVTADGRDAAPDQETVDVHRHGKLTAKIEFDPGRSHRSLVEAVAREAAAEIDNVALRAELSRQLELITESRSRLATAQLDERRRIERDLHDGAQQRLLAIALHLQSARLNGSSTVLREELDRAVTDLGVTVQELRELARGLQPTALAGGGLLAAVVDMVGRTPLDITYDVVEQRYPPGIEGAAWFVIAEAVTNAVKHAQVDELSVTVHQSGDALQVAVADRGAGGADPRGPGLQGLADRVSALRGSLCVRDNVPRGTVVEAELPCGW